MLCFALPVAGAAPIPHDSMRFILANSQYTPVNQIPQGAYVLLPNRVDGPVPTVDNLIAEGHFAFVAFRVENVTANHLTLAKRMVFEDDASAATAQATAQATYGNLNIYFPIVPQNNGEEQMFLRAILALNDVLIQQDPHLQPPQPPQQPIHQQLPAPPGAGIMEQLVQGHAQIAQGQANQLAESKKTVAKCALYNRLEQLTRVFDEGKAELTKSRLMFALPAGQEPSAGYISAHEFIRVFRQKSADFAMDIPNRQLAITDAKLEHLVFLLFDPIHNCSLLDFAVPMELPLFFQNLRPFLERISEFFTLVFGPALPMAIIEAARQLIEFHETLMVPTLIPLDVVKLLDSRIFRIDQDERFDINRPPNGRSLAQNLNDYFRFTHNDAEIIRRINARAAAAASELDSAAAPTKKQRRQRNDTGAGASSTSAATAASTSAAPMTRAKSAAQAAAEKIALKNWHDELRTSVPQLAGVALPCLHFLANKAPCHNQPICKKLNNTKTHNVPPLVTTHMAAVREWLKRDPLGRFP